MDAQTYLAAVRARMTQSGYNATDQLLPTGASLIGYRSDFRFSWAATKLHLFIAVRQVPTASSAGLKNFTDEALAYGKQTKGRIRGLQTGVAVIACLVVDQVETSAAEFAENHLTQQFAAFAWPVIVDLTAGQCYSHRGAPWKGRLYTDWMRQQIATVLSDPLGGPVEEPR